MRDSRRRPCRARRGRWARWLTNLLEVLRLLRDLVCVGILVLVCVLVLLTLPFICDVFLMVIIASVLRSTWLRFFVLITFLDRLFVQFMGMGMQIGSGSTWFGYVRLLRSEGAD